jgi:hypothetical protein
VRTWVGGLLVNGVLVAAVTGLIALLEPHVRVEGLAVLYLPVVLFAAIGWGVALAVVVSLASAPRVHTLPAPDGAFSVTDWGDQIALAVYLVAALVVGQLAGLLRRETREVGTLVTEQAALRRVATLVAQAPPAGEVFEAVTREVGLLCDADLARMERYEVDGTVTGLGAWSRTEGQLAVGTRFALVGVSVAASVLETGSPCASRRSPARTARSRTKRALSASARQSAVRSWSAEGSGG